MVTSLVNEAVTNAGMKGDTPNLTIADRLGCLDEAGLKEMRQGKATTVKRESCIGDELSVGRITRPRAVVPELWTTSSPTLN